MTTARQRRFVAPQATARSRNWNLALGDDVRDLEFARTSSGALVVFACRLTCRPATLR